MSIGLVLQFRVKQVKKRCDDLLLFFDCAKNSDPRKPKQLCLRLFHSEC